MTDIILFCIVLTTRLIDWNPYNIINISYGSYSFLLINKLLFSKYRLADFLIYLNFQSKENYIFNYIINQNTKTMNYNYYLFSRLKKHIIVSYWRVKLWRTYLTSVTLLLGHSEMGFVFEIMLRLHCNNTLNKKLTISNVIDFCC